MCFFSVGLSLLVQHFQQVSWVPEVTSVSWLGQLTVGNKNTTYEWNDSVNCPSQETEVTSILTRHVENVVLTTKGLQE